MKIETPLHADHQLDQLAGQFEHWRQTRSHRGERIPQALWDQAVALARVLPHTRVAQHLRLAPNDLKKQMAMQVDPHAAPCRTMPGFVEVPLATTQCSGRADNRDRTCNAKMAPGCACTSPTRTLTAIVRSFLEA